MLAVTAVKTLGADREAVTDVLLCSCQRLCVHWAMHFDGDSDGPKNAHRMPVSMVDAARCMLDVISCRADDGDSDGPKNAHRMPVSMVDAARCMLDVISCRADDTARMRRDPGAGSAQDVQQEQVQTAGLM